MNVGFLPWENTYGSARSDESLDGVVGPCDYKLGIQRRESDSAGVHL